MASVLPASSLAPALRQQSPMLSLRLRSSSSILSSKSSRASISQFSTQSQTCRHQLRKQMSSISLQPLPSSQTRSLMTRIARPFSKASSTKSSATSPTTSTTATTGLPPSSAGLQQQQPPLPLTNLPYFIRRTPSSLLPVYLVTKSGGTRKQTKVQKVEGDVDALRADLARVLGLDQNSPDITVNRLNNHIVVKGWRKPEIQQFLLDRKF
ncbi:hypothetical protein AJ80_04343 [Polytolypa hystricis UAMH7299]|uniref:Large ribosomal subunit protein mL49 n=1 Tax=Polytolypa hystricis (strain UAMH7299) TaxID=1447883 RepID=A0A2B7YD12_POLH7|nr:hypothetical protein AJ80_04343 [Polytolypa hystricis UAMH7299]